MNKPKQKSEKLAVFLCIVCATAPMKLREKKKSGAARAATEFISAYRKGNNRK